MKIQVGDRLSVRGELCTIRFIGDIPQWKDSKAFGLEWDNPKRGRHNGSVDGVSYFQTSESNAGSLIKQSKLIEALKNRRSFTEAMADVYLRGNELQEDVYFGTKKAEMYGLDVLTSKNQDSENTHNADLSRRYIACCGLQDDLVLFHKQFKNLMKLDLSFNLFTEFSEIAKIIEGLPNLQSLSVSGNLFTIGDSSIKRGVFPLEELKANYCRMSNDKINSLGKMFPQLRRMEISGNNLENSNDLSIPPLVQELSLADNNLSSIPLFISNSVISYLNMSSNRISRLIRGNFQNIKALDLSHCEIDSWDFIDELCECFPNVISLKIFGNPLTRDQNNDDVFLQMIGRNRHLAYLDGTMITGKVRSEAEIYFMAQVAKTKAAISSKSAQWNYLKEKHGIVSRKIEEDSVINQLDVLEITLIHDGRKIQKVSLLPCYSIRYIKTIISRLLSLSITDFKLNYVILNGVVQEFTFEFSPISTYSLSSGDSICVVTKDLGKS